MKKQTVLVISDMHIPFQHPDMLAFFKALKSKYSPTDIVCIGDEVDFAGISFHDSSVDLPSAGDELKQSIKVLKQVYTLFPKCTVVNSNHGSLLARRALAHGIPSDLIKESADFLQAPKGWKWVNDLKLSSPIGPMYFCHGKSGSPGKLAGQFGMSTIQGHYHSLAQVQYISTPERLMFDMHVGCLVDDKSLAMAYNKLTVKRPIISVGLIENGIARIIPMVLSKGGRWIGKL